MGPNVAGTVIPARVFYNIGMDVESRWMYYSQYGMSVSTIGPVLRQCWMKLIRIMIAIKGDAQNHASLVPCWHKSNPNVVCQVYSTIFLHFLQPFFAVTQLDFPLSPSTNKQLLETIRLIFFVLYPKPTRTTNKKVKLDLKDVDNSSTPTHMEISRMVTAFWADQWVFGNEMMHFASYNIAPIDSTATQCILQEILTHLLLGRNDWEMFVEYEPQFSVYSPDIRPQSIAVGNQNSRIAQMGRITYLQGLYSLVHEQRYNTSTSTAQQIASIYRTIVMRTVEPLE